MILQFIPKLKIHKISSLNSFVFTVSFPPSPSWTHLAFEARPLFSYLEEISSLPMVHTLHLSSDILAVKLSVYRQLL